MKTQKILFIIVLFFSLLLSASALKAQLTIPLQKNLTGEKKAEIFKRIGTELVPDNPSSLNFYPVNDGDFWEYITADTTTLLGQFYYNGLNFSITKEITGDTLMLNSITYKKIKWKNIANSVNYPEWYDYHRVDSTGNVHLFYQDSDYLLFDFSLNIGQSYPAHLPNHIWKIIDRYSVIGFGDTLEAIDFELLEQGTLLKKRYTIVENFGIIYYQKNIDDSSLPEGGFWGAVIHGAEFGTMIATKKEVDWSKFYPLHIGDYWVYEGQSGSIPTINTVRIISDTLMSDGNIYFKMLEVDHTFGYSYYSYKRIDTVGTITLWEYWANRSVEYFRFSDTVGDTLGSMFPLYSFRFDDKYISIFSGVLELHNFLYPDIAYYMENYDFTFGLFYTTGELTWNLLKGAYIDGKVVWGDTIVTSVTDVNLAEVDDYTVFPSYPNPFNSTSTFSYYLPLASTVEIVLFNSLGEKIRTIYSGYLPTGYHKQIINAQDLPSGVYFVLMNVNNIQLVNKIIYLK